MIVVNDGSTDATADVAKGFGDPVRCLDVPHGGVSQARNRGIAEARAPYVALLDSDDLWDPSKLRVQTAALDSSPDIGLVFVAARRVDVHGRVTEIVPARQFDDFCEALLLFSTVLSGSCSSVMFRSSVVKAAGGFDSRFDYCEDWHFYLRASAVAGFRAIDEPLMSYRARSGSASRNIPSLERATFAILDEFFASDPRSIQYKPIRRRVYSNHWLICSGSYLHAGAFRDSIRCLSRGLAADPTNAGRPLGMPVRLARRLVARRPRGGEVR